MLKYFFSIVAFAAGISCARGAMRPPDTGRPMRGMVVSAGPGAIALATGPLVLHAYAGSSGARVYVAPATTGTDRDCAPPPDTATLVEPAFAAQALPRDRSVVLEVPSGAVACVTAGETKPVEVLWHAVAPREPMNTMATHVPGPVAECCTRGKR